MKSLEAKFLLCITAMVLVVSGFHLFRTITDQDKIVHDLVDARLALALEMDRAVRGYVIDEIRPRVMELVQDGDFQPELMSSTFIARSVFERAQEALPEYRIRFSSENPRNPRNLAAPDEQQILTYFRDNPEADYFQGLVTLSDGAYAVAARPRYIDENCMQCHGDPANAPQGVVERYGDTAGFHREVGELAAVDMIALPIEPIHEHLYGRLQQRAGELVIAALIGVLATYLLFRRLISRRLHAISRHFERLSLDQSPQLTLPPPKGDDAISRLEASYNRMASQVANAYADLESRVEERTAEFRTVNERLEYALDATQEGMWDWDIPSDHIYVSRRWSEMLGFEQGEIEPNSKAWASLVHPDDLPLVMEKLEAHLRGESDYLYAEHRMRCKDGAYIWLLAQGRVVTRDENGRPTRMVGTNTDITQRKIFEHELRRANKYQQLILDTSVTAIMTVDANRRITSVNRAFTRLLAYRPEELIGQHCSVIRGGDCAHTCKLFDDGQCGQIDCEERRITTRDGRQLITLKNAVQLKDDEGNVTGGVESFVDVTELVQARHAAEAANTAKSHFLANMSHEIRTPMTAILGYADLLLSPDQTPAEQLNCVQTIRRNGRHLLTIINDLLDLSKIEAGKMVVEPSRFGVGETLADIASTMRVRAQAKGLSLAVEFVGPIPQTIESDPTRVRQVLINLVGNAIKFTEEGGVRLITRLVQQTGGGKGSGNQLRFEVVDTGMGIDQDQLDHIFEPFSQADDSQSRRFGGTGLGLAISRQLANILGGDLQVQSTPGRGSSFILSIDAGSLEGVDLVDSPCESRFLAAQPASDSPAATIRGLRILLAEDGPDNQRLISYILRKAGADVVVAPNGRVAVELISERMDQAETEHQDSRSGLPQFDLVLMDVQMPEMDGHAAARRLRAMNFHQPIVALTAHAMPSDRQASLDAGCDEYATKPIDRQQLFAIISRLTAAHQTHDETAEPAQRSAA